MRQCKLSLQKVVDVLLIFKLWQKTRDEGQAKDGGQVEDGGQAKDGGQEEDDRTEKVLQCKGCLNVVRDSKAKHLTMVPSLAPFPITGQLDHLAALTLSPLLLYTCAECSLIYESGSNVMIWHKTPAFLSVL